jgi:NitT/TauT family transport system permease protein
MSRVVPVVTVVLALVAFWYAMVVHMNAPWTRDQAARAGRGLTTAELVADTMAQSRPVLPAPHQVAVALWESTVNQRPTSPRSLLFHGWVTLSATLLGFAMGTLLGIVLALVIVHSRAMDLSLMPWLVASQTIPILAIAPMIIVVLNAVGVTGLVPKALISTYLSFFPVVVGMVKGLRAPESLQLDQMRTWSATAGQTLWYLRLPSSMPFLFASLKVAIAASLVGAIVGELPTGAVAGLGARLLSGSYFGQTLQIWAALFAAAILAGLLVGIVGLVQRLVLGRMGMQP